MTLSNASKPEPFSKTPVRAWVTSWDDARSSVYVIRQEVFVDEQHLTSSVYDDPDDELSVHVLAAVGNEIVGIGRVTYLFDDAQIAWVAVLEPMRRHGVGHAIMQRLIAVSMRRGSSVISLNAQTHALSFYERLGFRSVGRRFHMGGIEHQHMVMHVRERQAR